MLCSLQKLRLVGCENVLWSDNKGNSLLFHSLTCVRVFDIHKLLQACCVRRLPKLCDL